ncbi:MAG: AI-2E family transporter [Saprospiraceae bacterium]|nr:AI-2E family transporter [Saprospiraceae bacterium]
MQKISRTFWIVVSACIGIYLIYYFSDLVSFILASWLLSMLGQPIMHFLLYRLKLKKFSWGTSISAIITIILYIALIVMIGVLFIPIIIEQGSHLANIDYDKIANSLQVPITYINQKLQNIGLISSEQSVMDQLKEIVQKWFKPDRLSNVFGSILKIGSNLTLAIGSIIFITFFFLQESGLFQEYLVAIVPKRHENKILHVLEDSSKLLRRYFGGILIQITFFCLVCYIILNILGVDNALLISFFAGIMNVIPYVGPLIAMGFAAFITITSSVGLDFNQFILPLSIRSIAAIFGTQLIDNWLIQPFLFSKTVKAHPLEIFIVILVSAKIGGITGMVMAIPAYTILRVVAKAFLSEYKIVKKITEEMDSEPSLHTDATDMSVRDQNNSEDVAAHL